VDFTETESESEACDRAFHGVREKLAVAFGLAALLAITIAHDLLRKAHEAGDLKSGLGDTHSAVHLENLAACAFAIAMACAFSTMMLALRHRIGERFFIALGAAITLAVPCWVLSLW
jgi:hypothetical protein